ncbi:hypothetical protein C5142_07070 [Rhodococcus sp. BGS-1C]|uniref:hypothetical protein n=1 Tax=Nocardiaceae TaxID=85025 RepID=UPI0019D05560|nr:MULTISPECIES: hypothetical protein [Rhodococcus]MCC8928487.1 hypothetical protein [Rhodococcus sp. I2R]MCZ4277109.1 hypothetical protein [Rhodococcus yunnanensis]
MTEIQAWAASRTDSVRVHAGESGLPVSIQIDPGELRYSGEELARTILDLCGRATSAARAERRTRLEQDGMDPDVLDRLGLPTAAAVAEAENERLDNETGRTGWMNSL